MDKELEYKFQNQYETRREAIEEIVSLLEPTDKEEND